MAFTMPLLYDLCDLYFGCLEAFVPIQFFKLRYSSLKYHQIHPFKELHTLWFLVC